MSLERTARKAGELERGSRGGAGEVATPGKRTLTASVAPVAPAGPASHAAPHGAGGGKPPRPRRAQPGSPGSPGSYDELDPQALAHTDPALLAAIAGPGAAPQSGAAVAAPAAAPKPAAGVVQRQQSGKPPTAATCNIPFPRVQYETPNGPICRRFDGVVTYSTVSKARLAASGYNFWITDAGFDKWVKVDRSSELWVQLSKINAATSEKAIRQLRAMIAKRKEQLDRMEVVAKLMNDKDIDPEVAAAAREDWDEQVAEFPGFDEDYAEVPALRDQVDAEHRKAFEAEIDELMEQRDRWDPQSTRP